MKIYNTKYALTTGITQHNAENDGSMATIREEGSYPMHLHGEGKEWHRTKEGAIERAEELRIKKLKSLDKQVKKISALVFD